MLVPFSFPFFTLNLKTLHHSHGRSYSHLPLDSPGQNSFIFCLPDLWATPLALQTNLLKTNNPKKNPFTSNFMLRICFTVFIFIIFLLLGIRTLMNFRNFIPFSPSKSSRLRGLRFFWKSIPDRPREILQGGFEGVFWEGAAQYPGGLWGKKGKGGWLFGSL